MNEDEPTTHHDVRNVISGTGFGTTVQAGSIGTLNLGHGEPLRTYYRELVLQIAPKKLAEREGELADLAEFCTSATPAHPYLWLRADPWAGKSALLAWFVLNPPRGIRTVSYFVTARFAGNDTREAFLESVLEQLAVLLGRSASPQSSGTNRDNQLLGMLSEAAAACEQEGERLILVVDGIDEDRSSAGYSIAALLPIRPANGLRVIVSGRPQS